MRTLGSRLMQPARFTPYLAFSFLLAWLMAGMMAVQTVGHWVDVPLVRTSFWLPLVPGIWLALRFFPQTRSGIGIFLLLAAALAVIGLASAQCIDFSADGMGYQQPGAEALLHGWNPLGPDADMLWQNVYPSGAWEIEATLAALYGSIESAKMLVIWWLAVSLPLAVAWVSPGPARAPLWRIGAIFLLFASPVVSSQSLTQYIDAPLYLAGLSFLFAFLLENRVASRERAAFRIIMAAALAFLVGAKLSGAYHAVTLSALALGMRAMETRRMPWRLATGLLITGLVAVVVVNTRPYVTNLLRYHQFFHISADYRDAESFSAAQRPPNLASKNALARFAFSLFAETDNRPHQSTRLKWPWNLNMSEWTAAGASDPRAAGFGPLFAFGLLMTVLWTAVRWRLGARPAPLLLVLSVGLLLASAGFPEGWWARYVPFAYAAPFFLLLSLPEARNGVSRVLLYIILYVFACNAFLAGLSAWQQHRFEEIRFEEMLTTLRTVHRSSVTLLPPGEDYPIYNHGYQSLTRWLNAAGIRATVTPRVSCPRNAGTWSEFTVCY